MSEQTTKKAVAEKNSHRVAARVLVWILAITMIFTTVAATLSGNFAKAAAQNFIFSDIIDGTPLAEATKFLKDNNILSGYPDGSFKPEGDITRAEMAKIIACFHSDAHVVKNAVTGFSDIDDAMHWSGGYVKAVQDLAIINGFPDGKFYPDNKVTYEQAIKMVVCAMGYTGLDYPNGYIRFAQTINLLKNSTHAKKNSEPTTRGAVAVLVYNAAQLMQQGVHTLLPHNIKSDVLGSAANPHPDQLTGVDKLRVAGYRLFNDAPLNYEFAAGADEFTAKYGIDVEFLVGGGNGMGDDLLAVIATGDPWDLQFAWGISTFPTPMAKGIYTPLTAYLDYQTDDAGHYLIDENGRYVFTDPRLDTVTMDGTLWGGEYYGISESQMQEFVAIVYNETWFRELGIETPHDLLARGEWNLEGYKKVAGQARAKGANFGGNYLRPHVVGTYMTEWNGDYPTNTFDSEANTQWLQFWYDLCAGEEYQYGAPNSVYKRKSIMTDEVFPNRIKDEFGTLEDPIEPEDTLRTIFFPNEEGTNTAYITDSHFLVPAGVKEANIPAAVELASAMVNMKGNMVDDLYGIMLPEEDYNLLQETYKGFYYLPRFVNTTIWGRIAGAFIGSVDEKKPVATFIEEYTPVVQSAVDEFIETYGVTPEGNLTKTTEEMLAETQAERAEREAISEKFRQHAAAAE